MDLKLLPKQFEFFTDLETKELSLLSGIGAGKSFTLMCAFIINEILAYPNALHCFMALSYPQLRDASIPLFESLLEQFNIQYKFNRTLFEFTILGTTKVIFRSLDTADKLRSVEIGSLYIEELSYADEKNFMTALGRLRDKKGSLRLRCAWTANGFDHFTYRYFIESVTDKRKYIKMSTYENKHLPDGYIEALEAAYDPLTFRQEVLAEFVARGADRVYFTFDRERHVKEFTKERPRLFGMDFNVNPLTAVGIKLKDDGIIYVSHEYFLENSNTYELSQQLYDDYKKIQVVADSTGNSRRTSATKTDHQVLSEAGLEVARFRNPLVKDRINHINNLLHKNKLVIHTDCVHVIRDLEKLKRDNREADLSHISDALGYAVWFLCPPEIRQKTTTKQL